MRPQEPQPSQKENIWHIGVQILKTNLLVNAARHHDNQQHKNKPLAHRFMTVEGLVNTVPEVYYFPLSVIIKN